MLVAIIRSMDLGFPPEVVRGAGSFTTAMPSGRRRRPKTSTSPALATTESKIFIRICLARTPTSKCTSNQPPSEPLSPAKQDLGPTAGRTRKTRSGGDSRSRFEPAALLPWRPRPAAAVPAGGHDQGPHVEDRCLSKPNGCTAQVASPPPWPRIRTMLPGKSASHTTKSSTTTLPGSQPRHRPKGPTLHHCAVKKKKPRRRCDARASLGSACRRRRGEAGRGGGPGGG